MIEQLSAKQIRSHGRCVVAHKIAIAACILLAMVCVFVGVAFAQTDTFLCLALALIQTLCAGMNYAGMRMHQTFLSDQIAVK